MERSLVIIFPSLQPNGRITQDNIGDHLSHYLLEFSRKKMRTRFEKIKPLTISFNATFIDLKYW